MELLPSSVIQGMFGLRVWHEKNWDFWITELLDSGVTWIQILQERGAGKSLWECREVSLECRASSAGAGKQSWWEPRVAVVGHWEPRTGRLAQVGQWPGGQ